MPVSFSGSLKRALVLPCVALIALGLSACAKTVSTSGLSGEAKDAAETIKALQSDVTAGDQKKVCANDLAKTLVTKLDTASGGCQQAVKNQLAEIDSLELNIDTVQVTSAGQTAKATVTSVYAGKKRKSTISLVKEGEKWKISAVS
jgi:Domain of unknown function (DUF4878)